MVKAEPSTSKNTVIIMITDRPKALLADKGYDSVYGARPLKRTIQRLIQDPLAVKILEGSSKRVTESRSTRLATKWYFATTAPS